MIREIIKQLKPALLLLLAIAFITGFLYVGIVTIIGQSFFPEKAEGSLIFLDGKPVGSQLIGQYFSEDKYFWSRPSAAAIFPYNSAETSASNLGPTNPALIKLIKRRINKLKKSNPGSRGLIPMDLVTASASGLDPDISPEAAYYQVHRIALARQLSDNEIRRIIDEHIKNRQFYFLGEARVNVLELNLALDKLKEDNGRSRGKTP